MAKLLVLIFAIIALVVSLGAFWLGFMAASMSDSSNSQIDLWPTGISLLASVAAFVAWWFWW